VRFLLDENLSHRVCSHLQEAGHDAVHVTDIGLDSALDETVMERARDEGRVLVSCDKDFVQMLFASGDSRPSFILTSDVDTLQSSELAGLLVDALSPELEELLMAGAIATLTPDRVRVRPLPLRKDAPS
jgi:predicted nuclease of predicted toxin-antitoxin system